MKTLCSIAWFFFIGVSSIGHAQTAQVHIAGSHYSATFSDTTLSADNQQRIAADLTTAFSLTTSSEKLKSMLSEDERRNVVFVDENNQKIMQIAKPLSDKYLNAFALMGNHSNAVQKANEFIALLNSTNLLSQPIQVLRDLHHLEPSAQGSLPPDHAFQEMATEIQRNTYLGFSALRFSLQRRPEAGQAEVPVIMLFMISKSDPSDTGGFPIAYYDGRWGAGISP